MFSRRVHAAPAPAAWTRRLNVFTLLLLMMLACASCQRIDQGPAADSPEVIRTQGGVEMVLIPAGRFVMGSDGGPADQAPAHEAWVDACLMDRYEVTQEQYSKLMLVNGSHFKGPTRPAEMVTWADAALYCNKRSEAEGLEPCYNEKGECNFEADGYRLPTEAEWEYACRAGSDAEYCFGSDRRQLTDYAWCGENAAKKTHPVGEKKPNAWGLYDMHGNVAEWCNDLYAADYYGQSPGKNPRGPVKGDKNVLRGGAWNASVEGCRAAYRVGEDPGFQDACFARDAIGFRCVRKPPSRAARAAVAALGGQLGLGCAQPPATPAQPPATGAAWTRRLSVLACMSEASSDTAGASSGERVSAAVEPSSLPGPAPSPPAKTGFLYGDVYLNHKTSETDPGHPERPERLKAIVARLEKSGLLAKLVPLKPQPVDRQWLLTIHSPKYVDHVQASCRNGAAYIDSPDTPLSRQSYEVALAAVGGVLGTLDAVMDGKVRNAFCAIRPPGHHATKDHAMGFCLLNNVAIAARYLQQKHKLARVLIVDWDVHHGNGTQAAFYDDPTVLYFSVHQDHFYPGTGSGAEKGAGKGLGFTLNVPLPAGSGDREYRRAFEDRLKPAALEFRPDFVLVSAGFDAHEHDTLGGMRLTAAGYAELTRIVRQIADQCCQGRLVALLEGGYGLEGLAASVEAHLRVLMQ